MYLYFVLVVDLLAILWRVAALSERNHEHVHLITVIAVRKGLQMRRVIRYEYGVVDLFYR